MVTLLRSAKTAPLWGVLGLFWSDLSVEKVWCTQEPYVSTALNVGNII
jgi:hypothetical protein